MLTGQNILLTGAGSPIGQGLVPRILEQDPTVLRLFDSNESHPEELMERFDDDRLRYLMGRVRDEQRVERAMEDVDVVLYIEDVVFISSVDPANPAHTMRAAELLGEKMPAIRLEDLTEVMVDQLAPQFGYESADIDVIYSDDQLNIRSNEEIMTKQGALRAYEDNLLYVIPPEGSCPSTFESQDEFPKLDGVPQSLEGMREVKRSELADSLADSETYVLYSRKMRR